MECRNKNLLNESGFNIELLTIESFNVAVHKECLVNRLKTEQLKVIFIQNSSSGVLNKKS